MKKTIHMNRTTTAAVLASALLLLLVIGVASVATAGSNDTRTCCKGKAHSIHGAEATPGAKACPMMASDDRPSGHNHAAIADTVRAERVHSHELHEDIQRVAIEVTSTGYTPATIRLERGLQTELVFTRTTASRCAAEVHIPDLGVAKTALPQGEAVTIRFTPETAGTFAFLCGMDMLRGSLIVE
jgi:heme/copper-type cytochrome/quinol oxidase subunit 2